MTETNKTKYCERFKYLAAVNKILPNEHKTVHELGAFGRSSNGNYRSQSGNDDLAITCVETAAFFESPNFWELVNEELDRLPKEYLSKVYSVYLGEAYLGNSSGYDHSALRELNTTAEIKKPGKLVNVFDEMTIDQIKRTRDTFYGNNSRSGYET